MSEQSFMILAISHPLLKSWWGTCKR